MNSNSQEVQWSLKWWHSDPHWGIPTNVWTLKTKRISKQHIRKNPSQTRVLSEVVHTFPTDPLAEKVLGYRLLTCWEEIRRTLKAKSYIQHPVLGSEGIPDRLGEAETAGPACCRPHARYSWNKRHCKATESHRKNKGLRKGSVWSIRK